MLLWFLINLLPIFLITSQVVLGESIKSDEKGDKLRVCIVEGRGSYKKGQKLCPLLERSSNLECVIGVDRLDCIRRVHKGSAHFGVFVSEDLIAARWAGVEVLVTSELRFHNTPFEYEIVAIVDNEADIHTIQDLRGSKFCHPGHDLEGHWTEVLANYFESVLVPKLCDPEISLVESRIKASAEFFGPSCKAGPWVPDPIQDKILKNRYPSLCELCYDSYRCGKGDKHWGRRGALYCLTTGIGQVAWARLDDVRSHFGLSGLSREADPNEYSYLCPDGHLQPINSIKPCVWVAKPWPVVAAKRSHASAIQDLVSSLSHDNIDWQNALLSLLETYHVNITSLDMTIPIDDYLNQAIGFQSAYSFPECNPPRSIVYCTTSIIQHIKCSWLQEASQVYGIEPNLQCIRAEDLERCLDDVKHNVADIVLVDQDNRIKAQRDYNLTPLLYEYAPAFHERYVTVAVVNKQSGYKNIEDLKGKKACFPSFEGAAYISALDTIRNKTKSSITISQFFSGDSCTWNPQRSSNCRDIYRGDEGALRCLVEGADVAFLSSETFKNFSSGILNTSWSKSVNYKDFRTICPYGLNNYDLKYNSCYLHWTVRGHLMTSNITIIRRNEIYNSLKDMDRLFGKHYKSHTVPFTMFGPFDKKNNIMFRDNTDDLKSITDLRKDKTPRLMEDVYSQYVTEIPISNSNIKLASVVHIIGSIFILLYLR